MENLNESEMKTECKDFLTAMKVHENPFSYCADGDLTETVKLRQKHECAHLTVQLSVLGQVTRSPPSQERPAARHSETLAVRWLPWQRCQVQELQAEQQRGPGGITLTPPH